MILTSLAGTITLFCRSLSSEYLRDRMYLHDYNEHEDNYHDDNYPSNSLEHPGGLAAELVPDRALQQTLHQAAEHVGERDLVT